MALWLLRPRDEESPLWTPWYDKAFGFVVEAPTAHEARTYASAQAGDEGPDAWMLQDESTCVELPSGVNGVIICDKRDA